MAEMSKIGPQPPMRCGAPDARGLYQVCGQPADYQTMGAPNSAISYRCRRHKRDGDVPIAGARQFRLVRVEAVVYFAAAYEHDTIARSEAVARLELGCTGAGGVLAVSSVETQMSRYYPPALPPGRGATADKG